MPPKAGYDDNFDNLESQMNALAPTEERLYQVQTDLASLDEKVSSLEAFGQNQELKIEIALLQDEANAADAEKDLIALISEVEELTLKVEAAEARAANQTPKNAPISIKRNTEEKSDKQIMAEILGVVAKNKLKSMASKLLRKSTSNSSR